jgi:hypothetical protein
MDTILASLSLSSFLTCCSCCPPAPCAASILFMRISAKSFSRTAIMFTEAETTVDTDEEEIRRERTFLRI